MEKKTESIQLKIFGESYTFKAKPSYDAQYIEEIARYVEQKMKEVSDSGTIVSTNRIAVLAALNMADELFKMHRKNKVTKDKISNLIDKINNKI